jgi:sugar-specific transcriptional regulator TrmB
VFFEEEENKLLIQIGFTKTQAKIYLTLLKLGEANGRMLCKNTNVPRSVVYRTLDELQKKGLVEKEITAPFTFVATPPKEGLQILMNQRLQQHTEMQVRIEEFLQKIQNYQKEILQEQEYKFIVIEGKERILQKIKLQHDTVQQTADILSTLQRWLQIIDDCYENYEKALERKVKYRVVIENPEYKINFPEKVQALLTKPNMKLRFSCSLLKTNSAIFDGKEASFNLFPSKSIAEAPIIWTNHPSFLAMCQDHFEAVWKSARQYKLEK